MSFICMWMKSSFNLQDAESLEMAWLWWVVKDVCYKFIHQIITTHTKKRYCRNLDSIIRPFRSVECQVSKAFFNKALDYLIRINNAAFTNYQHSEITKIVPLNILYQKSPTDSKLDTNYKLAFIDWSLLTHWSLIDWFGLSTSEISTEMLPQCNRHKHKSTICTHVQCCWVRIARCAYIMPVSQDFSDASASAYCTSGNQS